MIAEQVNPNGTVDFRIFVKPLVNLIWLAGLLFVLGSLITLWPDAREQRRLALRYGEARRARLDEVSLALVLAALLAVACVDRRRPAVPPGARARVATCSTSRTRSAAASSSWPRHATERCPR